MLLGAEGCRSPLVLLLLLLVLAAVARYGRAEGRERRLVRDVDLALLVGGLDGGRSEGSDGRGQGGGGERVGGDEDGERVLGEDGELLLLLLLLLSLLVSELHALSCRQLRRHGCVVGQRWDRGSDEGDQTGARGGEHNKRGRGSSCSFCPQLCNLPKTGARLWRGRESESRVSPFDCHFDPRFPRPICGESLVYAAIATRWTPRRCDLRNRATLRRLHENAISHSAQRIRATSLVVRCVLLGKASFTLTLAMLRLVRQKRST